MQTLITVGMPVYNAMPWLPEAIESLLGQTMGDFTILAVVDGGSDESLAWLKSIRDPRLRVVQQSHAGVTATLNRLLAETRTPWLVRQDADDVSYPERLACLLDAIETCPDAGLIYSLAEYYPPDRCAGRFRCSRGTPKELQTIVDRGYLLSICHSTVALHVEKVRAAGGYRMDLHAEDADLWWRMARRYEVQFLPHVLVGFRQNPNSVSSRFAEQQELAGLYVQYLLLSELWGWKPRPLPEIEQALLRMLEPRRMAAKIALRCFNMHLAQRRLLRSMGWLVRAASRSPSYVLRRICDEVHPVGIANGVAPQLFRQRRGELWG